MHPGEQVLLRVIGQGRWQHPFHEHGNHVRVLARDGNLLLSQTRCEQLSPARCCSRRPRRPGQAMDGIFYWTGKGLNWDAYGHNPASGDPNAKLPCTSRRQRLQHRRARRRSTTTSGARTTTSRWRRIRSATWRPAVRSPCPIRTSSTNGAWYGGSPYLGPDATGRAVGPTADPAFRHGRQSAHRRSRLRLHVALAQRARDHDQQHLPGRNDDDDAGRFPGIRNRRVELTEENSNAIQLSQSNLQDSGIRGDHSPPRSASLAQQQVNLTAGPATPPCPTAQRCRCGATAAAARRPARPRPAPSLNPAATGWSPVVITVPTGPDLQINLTNNLIVRRE